MKYAALKALIKKLQSQTRINRIARTADSVLKIEFEKGVEYFFDLTRGQNLVYKNQELPPKEYKAPFDSMLARLFSKTSVKSIELSGTDKIIYIKTAIKLGYKEQNGCLILEFTGKSSNAVIVDENGIVSGALRYELTEYRELKVGGKYFPPPIPPFSFDIFEIDDIDSYLEKLYGDKKAGALFGLKKQKIASIDKKIERLKTALNLLQKPDELVLESKKATKIGDLLLANASALNGYMKSIVLEDFDGTKIEVELPVARGQKELLSYFYQRAKKLKKKAEGTHLEKESLEGKISFLEAQKSAVAAASDEDSVKIYSPKPKKTDEKGVENDIFEVFYKDYKISVGKNRKGNEKLLKLAKANDVWFHVKDLPSAHAILHTGRQNVSDDVLAFAAKVCVELSTSQQGSFLVDFAKRRDVSPVEGSKVNYVNYKTLTVKKG